MLKSLDSFKLFSKSSKSFFPDEDKKREGKKKKNILITVSVEEKLRKEYKTWCARHGLQMNQAFLKSFELLKKSETTVMYFQLSHSQLLLATT